MNWAETVAAITPHMVRIDTPNGSGSGFFFALNADRTIVGIATANHVISHASTWEQPIHVTNTTTGSSTVLHPDERWITYSMDGSDSAAILFASDTIQLPETPLRLWPETSVVPVGSEVAWLGYPGLVAGELADPCFFTGNVSATKCPPCKYFLDGVSIHGVSGGPVFFNCSINGLCVIGTISQYWPNCAHGDALPGLAVANSVAHFVDVVAQVKSLDEARASSPQVPPPQQQ